MHHQQHWHPLKRQFPNTTEAIDAEVGPVEEELASIEPVEVPFEAMKAADAVAYVKSLDIFTDSDLLAELWDREDARKPKSRKTVMAALEEALADDPDVDPEE